jgi:hypothetical protein
MPQAALSSEHLKLIDQLRQSGVQVEYEHKSSTATGPGFSGDGDTVGKFQIPGVSVNGSGVDAGRFDFSVFTAEGTIPALALALVIMGGLAIFGSIGLFIAKQKRSAAVAALGGGLLIGLGVVAEEYPWVLAIGVVVALTGIGWFVWSEVQRHRAKADAERQHAALKAVTKAVEQTEPEVQAKVRSKVKVQMGERRTELSDVVAQAKGEA